MRLKKQYQEGHVDEVQIINLRKRTYQKTESRRETDKKAKKPPRSRYHLFMRTSSKK